MRLEPLCRIECRYNPNTAWTCVGEGEIDEEIEVWWFNVAAVVNEIAAAPPKLAWVRPPWA